MDEWGWEQLRPWLGARLELAVGPLFCITDGPTRGRPWSSAGAASFAGSTSGRASDAALRPPHQLWHAHALELAREGVALNIIHRQLGCANLARPRSTSKASTPRRSSPPSTCAGRR
jgi:hypothetical protein